MDLPLPVGPTTATSPPSGTRKLTPARTGAAVRRRRTSDRGTRSGPVGRSAASSASTAPSAGTGRLEDLGDAPHRGEPALDARQRPAERDRRPREVGEIAAEGDEGAQRDALIDHRLAAEPQHDEPADARRPAPSAATTRPGSGPGATPRAQVLVVEPAEVRDLPRLHGVGAHHGHAAEVLLDLGRQRAELLLHLRRPRLHLVVEALRDRGRGSGNGASAHSVSHGSIAHMAASVPTKVSVVPTASRCRSRRAGGAPRCRSTRATSGRRRGGRGRRPAACVRRCAKRSSRTSRSTHCPAPSMANREPMRATPCSGGEEQDDQHVARQGRLRRPRRGRRSRSSPSTGCRARSPWRRRGRAPRPRSAAGTGRDRRRAVARETFAPV